MINKDLVKAVYKKIDDMIDWVKILKRPVLGTAIELADNFILSEGMQYLNEKFGDKIPSKYVDEIEEALQCFVNEDYEGILNALPEGLDDAIDITPFEDDFEAVFFATNFNALVKLVRYYAKRKVA